MQALLESIGPFGPALVALVVALLLTPVAMRLAPRLGAVDKPSAERWHDRATPLLGGIAITAAIVTALLVFGDGGPRIWATIGGVLLLHGVGLVDDIRGVRPANKLVAQMVAAGILLLGGVRAGWPEDAIWSVPLTVFWVLGITNALNLLDNMDGLAAGIAGISGLAIAFCLLPFDYGHEAVIVALAVAGAALGFLPFNRHPARIFMGDSGSLPLGFGLAAATLLGTHQEAGHLAVVLAGPLLALAVPILDTTFVSVLRKWHGRGISQGGRDHLSHRLVALGIPERQAVRLLWGLAAVFGGAAVAGSRLGLVSSFLLLVMAILVSCLFGVVLGRVKVYTTVAVPAEAARTLQFRQTVLNYLRALAPIGADFVLCTVAYVASYLLRYEGVIPDDEQAVLEASLPVVVAAQLAALAMERVYRGVWRYFGTQDALRLARGCIAAGVVTALIVMFGWRNAKFSRAVLILDPALLVLLLFGARALARILSDALGRFPEDGMRVLVVGGGESGAMCLRALRARGDGHVTPVGILDDDPSLKKRLFHGVPVLGSRADLERVLAELRPEEVVLSTLPEDEHEIAALRDAAEEVGARLILSPYARAFVPL